MSRAIVTVARVAGHHALVMENDRLRAVILPELGGRVWTLEDRVRGRQWIWHRAGVPLTPSAPGAVYDDVWAGGWEELFPNDAAGRFEGRDLPDHGEWWTTAWDAVEATDAEAARVKLTATARIVQAACTKEFSLAHDSSALTVSYRIRSHETQAFHFLFKQHLPVQITPSCRLALPGGNVEAVDPAFGTLLQGPGPYQWPAATSVTGRGTDLRTIHPVTSLAREFVYVRDLPESWCGVDDLEAQASIRMDFDGRLMPYVWLFLSYGGWRDTYTAVLEPCTNLPKDLAHAVRVGQSAALAPGEVFETTVTVRLSALRDGAA